MYCVLCTMCSVHSKISWSVWSVSVNGPRPQKRLEAPLYMRKQPPKIQLDFNLKKNFSPLSYICEAWNISTLGWLIKLFFNWNMELNSLNKFLDYIRASWSAQRLPWNKKYRIFKIKIDLKKNIFLAYVIPGYQCVPSKMFAQSVQPFGQL